MAVLSNHLYNIGTWNARALNVHGKLFTKRIFRLMGKHEEFEMNSRYQM